MLGLNCSPRFSMLGVGKIVMRYLHSFITNAAGVLLSSTENCGAGHTGLDVVGGVLSCIGALIGSQRYLSLKILAFV